MGPENPPANRKARKRQNHKPKISKPTQSIPQYSESSPPVAGRSWDLHALIVLAFGTITATGVHDWKVGAYLLGGFAVIASLRTLFNNLKFILLVTAIL